MFSHSSPHHGTGWSVFSATRLGVLDESSSQEPDYDVFSNFPADDPFLDDALEGIDQVGEPAGDHDSVLDELRAAEGDRRRADFLDCTRVVQSSSLGRAVEGLHHTCLTT